MRPVKYKEADEDQNEFEYPEEEKQFERPKKQHARASSTDNSHNKHSIEEEQYQPRSPATQQIEMQYLSNNSNKVKRHHFDNVASASRKTGVNSDFLLGVCNDGGGFLGGFWFSYSPDVDLPKKNKLFFLPRRFDKSSLRPLRGKFHDNQSWDYLVELICKKTANPAVAFPSEIVAAHALGIQPHQVRRASDSFGTGQQYDFPSFMLRITKESRVYIYGSHRDDYDNKESVPTDIVTTHGTAHVTTHTPASNIREWKDDAATPATPGRKKTKDKKDTPDGSAKEKRVRNLRKKIIGNTLSFFSESFEEPAQLPFLEESRRCIFCQQTNAAVLFEPCGHSVVCEACATWSCKTFCPRCRMAIHVRKKSLSEFRGLKIDLGKKPMVFSAYSFMDIS